MSEEIIMDQKEYYKYSDELIVRLQKYCKEKTGVEITKAEADLYLDSMARLYRSFADMN